MTLAQHLTNDTQTPHFIVSKLATDGAGRVNKFPCNPRGVTSDHKDPNNHMTLAQAEATVESLGATHRLGYSLRAEDKRFLIDIDHALVDGEWSQLAKDLCQAYPRCFMEISQSGTGLHIMGRYTGTLTHKNKNTALGIELYTADRFVLFGGIEPQGDWNTDATLSLGLTVLQYFNKDDVEVPTGPGALDVEVPEGGLSDEQVIYRCRASVSAHNVFGKGASFKDLYEANEDVLSRSYPSQSQGKSYDASAADLAIANMIATHTLESGQIIRIMMGSDLIRDKWTDHKTYLPDTVTKAISSRRVTLTQQAQGTPTKSDSQEILSDMPPEFEGCYFVKSQGRIFTPQHGVLNVDALNICFGSAHLKELPYKTFRTHAANSDRLVDRLGFRPDLPHGEVSEREGTRSVNSYKPISIRMQKGSMEPFFRFFNAMIPNDRDQKILLSYAAVLAQKPGVKSQWAPVIQGVQGCGKSLFADFVAYACGETYTHRAKGDEFEGKFNYQWFAKTLILIEDPRMKDAKLEEVLKPLITSKYLAFEGKCKDVHMNDFPANFILTLNDFDLLQKRADSRRLSVFMSALQTPEDLMLAGMTPATYRGIIDWRDSIGYEFFADFIHTYKADPEFDFSGDCVTAPDTSTTARAIEDSRPEIESRILSEVAQGRVGFRGGWISSSMLTDFAEMKRLRHLLPDRKRGQILGGLGYVYHPGLQDGRAVRNISPDNKRSALFVKKDHHTIGMTDRELIVREYEQAQQQD
jgi:Family of unknown function (DUF5906)